MSEMDEEVTTREKAEAIIDIATFKPLLTGMILLLSIVAALLEGIGISFLIPIIERSQTGGTGDSSGVIEIFERVYQTIGIPFTFETIMVGILVVMTARYTSSFVVGWFRMILRTDYVKDLRVRVYRNSLDAEIEYFDANGSETILNVLVTQSTNAGRVVSRVLQIVEQGILSLVYLSIALILAPRLTLLAGVFLAVLMFVIRNVLESGYSMGDRLARHNENVQKTAQAGILGIRDVKLFGLTDELFGNFVDAVDQWEQTVVKIRRNREAMSQGYNLLTVFTMILLLYVALAYSSLSIAGMGALLFSMFRLAPRVSTLNSLVYKIEGDLPHLVRTEQLITKLQAIPEQSGETTDVAEIETVAFENVSFAYNDETVLHDIDFQIDRGEFVGFVGKSGAGKSTVISLLTKFYLPDAGQITVNGTSLEAIDTTAWREHIAIVRQSPHIFSGTLEENLTIGNRDATADELDRVCDIAKVTEFLEDFPKGYQTVLGEDGVKLSGGQRQRVALARALLTDAELLILDEATSDLDSKLEQEVHEAIETIEQDYTVLAIAHRLSTVHNADRIYTMDQGRIVEHGTHTELLEQDGQYSELQSIQSQDVP